MSAESTKIFWGAAPKDLDRIEHVVNPHYIESGKIWGRGHGPPGPPAGSAGRVLMNSIF